MKPLQLTLLSCLAVPLLAVADEAPLAESAPMTFAVDTLSMPRRISTRSDLAGLWPLTYRTGETVRSSGGGQERTLVTKAAEPGTYAWQPDAGGLWTLSNSGSGEATFSVRDALFGDIGSGTLEDPFRISDPDVFKEQLEIASVTNGLVFRLTGGEGVLDALTLPAGYAFVGVGEATYRLTADATGLLFRCNPAVFAMDSVEPGPNRSIDANDDFQMPVAYSGDGWLGSPTLPSTLTVVTPRGAESVLRLNGWGVTPVLMRKGGTWTVTLASTSGTETAEIGVNPSGMMFLVR